MAVPKDPKELETADPFRALFPIDPAVRDLVARSIRETGYDPTKPILAWRDAFGERGRTVVVDGHTRRAVAIDLGLENIPVTMRRFDSVDAAIAAAIGEQAQRRNLNPSQLAIHVLTMLDHFDDGSRGQGARNDLYGRSAKQLAEMIGVTSRTIERARQLIAFGDDALLAQVKAGEIGLKTAVERGREHDATHSRATDPPSSTPDPAPEPEPAPRIPAHDLALIVDGYIELRDRYEHDREHYPDDVRDDDYAELFRTHDTLIDLLGRDGLDAVIAEREAKRAAATTEPPATAEPEPFIRPRAPKREPRIGEAIPKGIHERVRLAENALRLMWWEFERDLPVWLKNAEDADDRVVAIDIFDRMVDEDSTLADMLDEMRGLVADARGGANLLKRIEAMRNTAGRTPAEAAMFAAKADELEAKGMAG